MAWLLIVGVGLAALNLRTAITSVGPLLDEVTGGLGMSGTLAGVLTTLPVLCFAVFGALAPTLIRRFGEHHVLVGALVALGAGLGARAFSADPWLFLILSAIALSGGAVGNVLLPTLVKQHFPDRVGAMTTLYTTTLALGTTLAAAATVPLEQASGSWRIALGSYAVYALVAVLPWLLVLRHEPPRTDPAEALGLGRVLRTRMGRQSVLYFGTQSTVAYILFGWFAQMLRDQGMDAANAGLLLSYLTALAVPCSLVLPGLMARVRDHRGFVVFFYVAYVIGLVGMWFSPIKGIWVWTTFIGLGMGAFTLALTFFAVRTRTAPATAALSAASQSLGYLMGGLGPFLFGLLHHTSGGWHAPLAMVFGIITVNLVVGLLLGRPLYLEDQLTRDSAASRPAR
ncbi:CP family cyanate transporter-like MFS transporter [Nocardiopsis mwathae]|uniref:CP family cyanate transporter-like MFS transporter n=1 Tax=Nocardiopsis mwathae TaxID=1472723 RepID=A0A7W9YH89_9ACTN|nr:CP family cyanate transporter-like MFS transporter [Nocardiopsis mwathae]